MEQTPSGAAETAQTPKPTRKFTTALVAAVGGLCVLSGLCVAAGAMRGGEPAPSGPTAEDRCRTSDLGGCTEACASGVEWTCERKRQLEEAAREDARRDAERAAEARAAREAAERRAAAAAAAAAAAPPPAATLPPPPATAPTAVAGSRLEFPAEVTRFHRMNELQQDAYAATFGRNTLAGSGRIVTVENCGFLDESERWGRDCIMVTVRDGGARAALYFSSARRAEIAALSEGQRYSFDNCTTVTIRNWGFWSTATCDMP
jgi:hypothetical protein